MSVLSKCALRIASALGAVGLALGAASPAKAEFPERPLRMVVGYAPGGGTDIIARIAAEGMSERLGQPIVVENRGGAGGVVGATSVLQAPADGHTMMILTPGLLQTAALGVPMSFDVVDAWAPVGMVASGAVVLVVHPGVPARTLQELQTVARNAPSPLRIATPSVGLTAQYFAQQLGIEIEEVRYRGTSAVMNDLLAGRVEAYAIGLAGIQASVETGDLRAIAIAAPRRSPVLPSVPTTVEQGYGDLLTSNWVGLVVRAGTPPDRIARLHDVLNATLADPEVNRRLVESGLDVEPSEAPGAFGEFLKEDRAKWDEVARRGNLRQ